MKKELCNENEPPRLVEGEDFYYENGLMVLTTRFLEKRGYCCGNGCRNCPYPKEDQSRNSSNSLRTGRAGLTGS